MTEYHRIDWMSERIGMSVPWIYENLKQVPHHRFGRAIRFTDECVAAYGRQTFRSPRPMETTGHKRKSA